MSGFAIVPDIRFVLRSLGRAPGFTLIAVATLGLGIGANTSAFSILNSVLLRPLPYPGADRLERLDRITTQSTRGAFSPADYLDALPALRAYGEVAAYAVSETSLAGPGRPAEATPGLRVSANLFSTLGVEPRLGRGFRAEEAVRGNHRVLLISDRYWQSRFGGDPAVVGRALRVNGEIHEIVGVLPDAINDWRHLGPFDVFRPLALTEGEARDRSSTWIRLVGRRSDAFTPEQARSLVADVGRRLAAEHPRVNGEAAWGLRPLKETLVPDNAPGVLAMLIGLSGFVLLIACSNLANLLLARTMARARELAVRAALGASRASLLRPLFVESLLLALAGGVCAVQMALWTNDWLNGISASGGGEPLVFLLDWNVLGWGFAASLFTVLAFGVAPAAFALRLDLIKTLKSGGRGTVGDRGHQRFRHVLIASQFALAMVLLAGAALFGHGLYELNQRRHGWEPDRLIAGAVNLPDDRYPGASAIDDFQRRVRERLEALPGVASASLSWSMPFFGLSEPRRYLVAGQETPEPGHEPQALVNGVSPGYFETVGTRLVGGRVFDDTDTAASPRVFVVNQAMARGLFGAESPVGRRIARAGGETLEWGEIVGVVGDIQSVLPERSAVAYQLYQPLAQEPRPRTEIAVRAHGAAPAALADPIRDAIAAVDADLPVRRLQTAETTLAEANRYPNIIGSLLSFLAALGLGLASLGIYGVVTRTVAQRTGEFGIRLALGARARDIVRLVLVSGSRLALVGSAVGLVGAAAVSRLIAASWPGLQTSSGPVLAGVAALLVGIGLVACYIPASRVSRIDPAQTLRAE